MPSLNSVHEFGSDRYSCENISFVASRSMHAAVTASTSSRLDTRCCCLCPDRKLLLDSAVGETCSFMGMKWASLYYVELCLKPPAWVYGVVYAALKLAAAAGAKYAPQVANHRSFKGKDSAADARRSWLACGLGSCWFAACLALHVSGVPFNAVPKASEFVQFEERTSSMCAALASATIDCFKLHTADAWHFMCCSGVLMIWLQVRHGARHAASSSTRRSRVSLGVPTTTVPYGNSPGH